MKAPQPAFSKPHSRWNKQTSWVPLACLYLQSQRLTSHRGAVYSEMQLQCMCWLQTVLRQTARAGPTRIPQEWQASCRPCPCGLAQKSCSLPNPRAMAQQGTDRAIVDAWVMFKRWPSTTWEAVSLFLLLPISVQSGNLPGY